MNKNSRDFVDSFLYTVFAVIAGLVILFLSMSRASYDIMAKDNDQDKLRNNLIEFTCVDDSGEKRDCNYRLPTTRMLPNNPFYGFKKVRDFLWLKFSQGEVNKCKTALLMADKKMTEARMLANGGETKMAIEASSEALEKLKFAKGLIPEEERYGDEANYLREQIYMAGLAYEDIVDGIELSFENESMSKELLEEKINEFNQENKQERQEKTI